MKTFLSGFAALVFGVSYLTAFSQTLNIPFEYKVIKGTWSASNGATGPVELYLDGVESPTKGYLTLASRFCSSVQKEVAIKKTDNGFGFETDMGGKCKMSTFTFVGPSSGNKYTGTFSGVAGTTYLEMILAK